MCVMARNIVLIRLMIYGNCVMSNKVQTISLQTRLGKIFTRQYIIFIVTPEIANSQLGEQIALTFLAMIFSKKTELSKRRRVGWSCETGTWYNE